MTSLPTRDVERPQLTDHLAATRRPQSAADDDLTSAVSMALPILVSLLALVLMIGGALMTAVLSPDLGSRLTTTLLGEKTFWYLTRASAFVAYGLLWWSMALGVAISNRMARVWLGGPTVSDLHEYASLLGLAFAAIHTLSLLGDHYIGYSLTEILVPFATQNYRPLWVGMGQIAFYLMIPVTFTFYIRRWIGGKAWRNIHMLSYGLFVLALAHGVFSGSDSGLGWVQLAYLASGLSLAALTYYRIQVRSRTA